MNKNVASSNGKLFYAVVLPYQNEGEDKLILHEVTIKDGEVTYGDKDTLVVNPEAVLLQKRESYPVG